ncbi:MAG TPA: thiamine phosphate synthase [Planctomycetes bacterium]|nr:thiamine phosphate synthase [Planctomycetota bacterium]
MADTRARWRGFYFITDSGLSVNGIVEDVRQALSAGVAIVQYREKRKTPPERRNEALEILALCRRAAVPFIVNDDCALAAEIGADGVHVGPHDVSCAEARKMLGTDAVIGVSVGTPEEAKLVEAAGASYVAASPVFPTPTKPDAGRPIGIEGVKAVRSAVTVPLAAIGGLNGENIPTVIAAGADLVCAISASLAGGLVAANIRMLMKGVR